MAPPDPVVSDSLVTLDQVPRFDAQVTTIVAVDTHGVAHVELLSTLTQTQIDVTVEELATRQRSSGNTQVAKNEWSF